MTRAECEEAVSHPGKFEGRAVYVPYFWEAYLNGMADSDDGMAIMFNVTKEDIDIFPELTGETIVEIAEDEQGFVVEIL